MTENPYAPGVYVKGDDERVANSARDAVALVFDGFLPKARSIEPVADEEPASVVETPTEVPTETPTPAPVPSPKALARKSQEDNKS